MKHTADKNSAKAEDTPQPPRRLRADTLASSVVLLLGVSVIQRAIGFGRGVLFCRWLSPDELGLWEMAFSFILLAAPLAVLGLPGSFGRYLEHYRQRGQLRTFLRRTTLSSAILTAAAVGTVLFAAPYFSKLIFGKADETTTTILVAVSLVAVILSHFLGAIFTAMRMYRVVSVMQFTQSTLFAAIGLALLTWWRLEAVSVVIAYGSACLISAIGAILWARPLATEIPADECHVSQRAFWPRLMRFAMWVWVSNLLCNLFTVVDRYMIVHHSGMAPEEALSLVGHYHSSRIVPLLLVSVAELLGGIVLPYLSKDWEAGRRSEVSSRLNFVLKLTSLGMIAASVAVMAGAPLLFDVAFRGKYDGGLAVLPMTLCYCSLFSVMVLAENYFWTSERARLCIVPLAIGLGVNIVLNLVLLPILGLAGAVLATTIANAACLGLAFWLCHVAGMRVDFGTLMLSAGVLTIGGGFEIATISLCVLLLLARKRDWLFTTDEINQIHTLLTDAVQRLRRTKTVTSGVCE